MEDLFISRLRLKLWILMLKRIFIGCFALKGLNAEAQGETLGNGIKKNMNPEGVQFAGAPLLFADRGCALSGRMFCALNTQGFTLGCHISPLWGGADRVVIFTCA